MAAASALAGEGNLPTQSTSFVGRRAEIAEARRMLTRARLVTMTGVGGVGKSRLALRVAAAVGDRFPDGVWLVELAFLHDPSLVPMTVAQVLGLRDQLRDPLRALTEHLRDRKLLLVLDNCEHLVDACVEFCETILRIASGVRILVTSRQSLSADGEQIQMVEPLSTPAPDDAGAVKSGRSDALRLFSDRAAAVVPGFTLGAKNRYAVAHVCHRLEGLPLAIELAAVRLGSLGLDQLVTQLDDRFEVLTAGTSVALPRHRTLRAAIDWSFQLCTPDEQRLWARASVFAGSFDLAAAEALGGQERSGAGAYDVVDGLVGKSVLVRDDGGGRTARYRLLETVRQYGQDKLYEAGETTTIRDRHLNWYLALAERFNAEWLGPHQLEWAERMHAELPNLRAAMGYCLSEPSRVSMGPRLAGALHYFWMCCGQTREGRLWLERALAAASPEPTPDWARALLAYGSVLTFQGLHDKAAEPLWDAVALARVLGTPEFLAHTLGYAGLNTMHRGDLPNGLRTTDEALAIASHSIDHPLARAVALWFRAVGAIMTSEPAQAMQLLMEARAICDAASEKWMLSWVLVTAIHPALIGGDPAMAGKFARECIPLHVAFNDPGTLNVAFNWLVPVAAAEQDFRRVARLFGAERRLALEVGGSPWDAGPLNRIREDGLAPTRAALGPKEFDAAFQEGYKLSYEDAVAYATQAR